MNIFCLIIWILNLIVTVNQTINKEPINPIIAICAIIVCILFYLERITG